MGKKQSERTTQIENAMLAVRTGALDTLSCLYCADPS